MGGPVPVIITIGAAVLAYTAAKMIVDEVVRCIFESNPFIKWAFIIIIIAGVVFFGKAKQKQQMVLSDDDVIFTNKDTIHLNSAFCYLFSFPSGVVFTFVLFLSRLL